MYKVKILEFVDVEDLCFSWIVKDHNIGDVIIISNEQYSYFKDKVKFDILEHYKIITVSKERCPHCNSWMIKSDKKYYFKKGENDKKR